MPGLLYKSSYKSKYRLKCKSSKKIARQLLTCWFFIAMVGNPVSLQAEKILAKEYFVKAAFLYNFARLVEWPAKTFSSDSDPIRLCFIGNNPFGEAIKTLENKTVKNRTLQIYRDIELDSASQCQILFISESEKNRMAIIPEQLNQYPVLTVSELPGFAQNQGHIRLYLDTDKTLSLEVNLDAIIRANLKISSRILTLATIVNSEEVIE